MSHHMAIEENMRKRRVRTRQGRKHLCSETSFHYNTAIYFASVKVMFRKFKFFLMNGQNFESEITLVKFTQNTQRNNRPRRESC